MAFLLQEQRLLSNGRRSPSPDSDDDFSHLRYDSSDPGDGAALSDAGTGSEEESVSSDEDEDPETREILEFVRRHENMPEAQAGLEAPPHALVATMAYHNPDRPDLPPRDPRDDHG